MSKSALSRPGASDGSSARASTVDPRVEIRGGVFDDVVSRPTLLRLDLSLRSIRPVKAADGVVARGQLK